MDEDGSLEKIEIALSALLPAYHYRQSDDSGSDEGSPLEVRIRTGIWEPLGCKLGSILHSIMISRLHISSLLLATLSLGSLRAQSTPSPDSTNPAMTNTPSVSALAPESSMVSKPIDAIERDARVPSDGKAWRIDQAIITDPTRPRVLLVGDSILNGYVHPVIGKLKGKAYVDAWVNPYCQSENYNKKLADVLEKGPYDVIHINTGLHGFQPGRIPEGQFEPLTKKFVEVIRTKCPKAKIIWASSTPVSVKGHNDQLDPVINPVVVEQNRMAAQVMIGMNIPVNDLYTLVVVHSELKRDPFHWQAGAYHLMAQACADAVTKQLPSTHQP